MIYCVVPRPLADELYPTLEQYYRDDENVTVIVDRRHNDRRAQSAAGGDVLPDEIRQRRVVRDRRRARVPGELPRLAGVPSQ